MGTKGTKLCLLSAFLFGIAAAVYTAPIVYYGFASSHWPQVVGKISGVDVNEVGSDTGATHMVATVFYQYQVGTEKFYSERVAFGQRTYACHNGRAP